MKGRHIFPMAAAWLRNLILLQLCLLACSAAVAQSLDQEIEAEAQKLLPTFFTKCGDDYFSKQTFRGNPDTYIIGQYKELTTRVTSYPLTKADPLNGIEWKGIIHFTATVKREFAHGPMFSQFLSTHKPDVWSEWREMGILAALGIPVERKNGRITMNRPTDRTSMDCATIPP
jgi:hypothetical protein